MPKRVNNLGQKGIFSTFHVWYILNISCFYVYNLTNAFGDCKIKP